MVTYEYGNPHAVITLVQPVDDHDMAGLEAEVAEIRRLAEKDFCLLAIKVNVHITASDQWIDVDR